MMTDDDNYHDLDNIIMTVKIIIMIMIMIIMRRRRKRRERRMIICISTKLLGQLPAYIRSCSAYTKVLMREFVLYTNFSVFSYAILDPRQLLGHRPAGP